MNSLTYRKIVNGLAAFCVIVAILIPDVIFELLSELFHYIAESLWEVADISFEWVESVLDNIVEHIFETDLHTTQIIVFYILMSVAALIAYRLWVILPRLYRRLMDGLVVMLEVNKVRFYMYWYSMTLMEKVKWAAVLITVISGYVFLGM